MYMFSKEVSYILENYTKFSYLDLREKIGFFSDIDNIKELDKELGTAIDIIRKIFIRIGKWFIVSSALLALLLIKEKDGTIDYIITVIVAGLYFTIGKAYVNL
jgi:hypothetical protein